MTDTARKTRIDRVVDYIQANLPAELNLKDLSVIACFSEFHFSRLFKDRMGESVYRFVRRLRLERAAMLLSSRPTLSVTDIALMCGFATPSAFAKSFKVHFKVSASQWRERGCRSAGTGLEGRTPASSNGPFPGGCSTPRRSASTFSTTIRK